MRKIMLILAVLLPARVAGAQDIYAAQRELQSKRSQRQAVEAEIAKLKQQPVKPQEECADASFTPQFAFFGGANFGFAGRPVREPTLQEFLKKGEDAISTIDIAETIILAARGGSSAEKWAPPSDVFVEETDVQEEYCQPQQQIGGGPWIYAPQDNRQWNGFNQTTTVNHGGVRIAPVTRVWNDNDINVRQNRNARHYSAPRIDRSVSQNNRFAETNRIDKSQHYNVSANSNQTERSAFSSSNVSHATQYNNIDSSSRTLSVNKRFKPVKEPKTSAARPKEVFSTPP